MIIYSVTINIDNDVHDDWLQWMKSVHIPDIMNTGLFIENRLLKLLNVDDEGTTYSIQYMLQSMNDYERYQQEFAPRLQAQHSQRYQDKFVAFRTLLEVM
jgi:hypothetical protein